MSDRLFKTIPTERINPYKRLSDSTGVGVLELYLWNLKLSLALFEDIQFVEVALRSAIAREMVYAYGLDWHKNEAILDTPALMEIKKIRNRSNKHEGSPQEIHGRIVASLTFGFWVKLLGKGAHLNKWDPKTRRVVSSERRIYDEILWKPAIRNAFPNADPLGRAFVESKARDLQSARNRVAHHEHIIWGIPAVGQTLKNGLERRMKVSEVHQNLLELASLIDVGLKEWIQENSSLNNVVERAPLTDTSSLSL
jgi:hypothetical protein